MTIVEEIEQLKISLEKITEKKVQADILLDILEKSTSLNISDSQAHFDHLIRIAEQINEPVYKAWGLTHLAFLKGNKGECEVSLDLCKQALSIFEQLKNNRGIAASYSNIGIVYCRIGNYSESLKNHNAALKIRREIGDKNGIGGSLSNIGIIYQNQGDYAHALSNNFAALKIREKIGNKRDIAISLRTIGLVYHLQSNFPEALKNHIASLKLSEEIGDKNAIARARSNIGIVFERLGNYTEALKNFYATLNVIKDFGNIGEIAGCYNNIGNIYLGQKNFSGALDNYVASLKLSEECGDKQGISDAYSNIGAIHHMQGNYTDALNNYFTSLNLRKELGDKKGIGISCNNIGIIFRMRCGYTESLKNHFESLKIYEEIGNKVGIASSFNSIGEVYYCQGNYTESLKMQLLALQLGEGVGHKTVIRDSLLSLCKVYKAIDDFEKALKYHEKYHQVENEMLGEQAQKQLTSLNFQHNMEQKEKDLEIEQLRNVELKKEREIVEKTLAEKEELLREKEMLLKEIHHRVKNNLQTISSMLMLQSAGIKDEQAKNAIAESQSRVRSIALVHQKLYQTDGLEQVELNAFIKDLTEQVKSVYRDQSNHVSINWRIPETYLLIDKAIPLGLIFNELLTNSFKYAFSGTKHGEINIELNCIDPIEPGAEVAGIRTKKIKLGYRDSGPGIKPGIKIEKATTLGLRLIKLLSQQIGATLDLMGSEFIFTFDINI